MSGRLTAHLRDERGVAMIYVVLLTSVLSLVSVLLMDVVQGESTRSAAGVQSQTAYEAAEAGVDDYIGKLVDDPLYYNHQVAAAEATRQTGATVVAAGNAWGLTNTWTYPSGKNAWRSAGNGYEYDLEITAPTASSPYVQILATGRKAGSNTGWRAIQAYARQTSISDFYRLVAGDVSFGSTTTTNGQVYAGGNIVHDGTATANLYAEGTITGSTSLTNGAKKFDGTTIRTVIKNPISFASFLTSLTDIQRAAAAGGGSLNSASAAGWRLVFSSNGTFTAQSCTQSGGNNVAAASPVCGSATTYSVPANGAVYAAQTPIVSGTVNGRVTVASPGDIVVAGNISYQTAGDDVLGLDAANDLTIAQWAPSTLTWSAAVLAQGGTWQTWSSDGSHSTMTFTGSAATANGGNMTMFQTRNYNFDSNLLYLPPPWFPAIDGFTVTFFREVKP